MNEEKRVKLEYLQKFFLTSFVVSFILLLFSGLVYMAFNEQIANMAAQMFNIDADEYIELYLLLMGIWKILIFQFTLIPAVAIWSMKKCCCVCKPKDE